MSVLLDRISHVSPVHQASCCSAHLFPTISSASWPPATAPASLAAPDWLVSAQLFVQHVVTFFHFTVVSALFTCWPTFSSSLCPVCLLLLSSSGKFDVAHLLQNVNLFNLLVKSPLTISIMVLLLYTLFVETLCSTLKTVDSSNTAAPTSVEHLVKYPLIKHIFLQYD